MVIGAVAAIPAAIQLGTSIYSAYAQSQEAKKAARQQAEASAAYQSAMKKISDRLSSEWADLGPMAQSGANSDPLTAEEYNAVLQYNPEVAQHVQEKYPELTNYAEAMQGEAAQKRALEGYEQEASGYSPVARARREEALMDSQQARQSALANILAQQQRGSGYSALLQNQASQDSLENQRKASLQSAQDAQQARMAALQGMGQLGGQVYGQGAQRAEKATDAINSFNQRNAQSKWLYEQNKANTLNEASKARASNAVDQKNRTTETNNQFQQYNRNMFNTNAWNQANAQNQWQQNNVNNQNQKLQNLTQLDSTARGNIYNNQKGNIAGSAAANNAWYSALPGIMDQTYNTYNKVAGNTNYNDPQQSWQDYFFGKKEDGLNIPQTNGGLGYR